MLRPIKETVSVYLSPPAEFADPPVVARKYDPSGHRQTVTDSGTTVTMSGRSDTLSILSHGEQDVAGYLREHPDATPADIAEARGVDEAAIEQAIDRLETKTHRAVVTLAESPFTEQALSSADSTTKQRLRAALAD